MPSGHVEYNQHGFICCADRLSGRVSEGAELEPPLTLAAHFSATVWGSWCLLLHGVVTFFKHSID